MGGDFQLNTHFMTKKTQIQKIGVIGAGIAGLAAARLLSSAGFDCEIFEKRDRVGGVWTAGYHTFGLQTPKSLYEIPDFPMPDNYPRLPTGEQLQTYFENYAKAFGLMEIIHFGCTIKKLDQNDAQSWSLQYSQHNSNTVHEKNFDFIVVATGLYSNPYIPHLPHRKSFEGHVLHSSQYVSPNQVKGKNVVVVGFGKSALDIATNATHYANRVTLLFREAHWPVPVDLLNLIDVRRIFFNRLVGGLLPLYQRPQNWHKKLHRYCPWLVKGFWRFVEFLLKLQFPLKACGVVPSTPPESDFFNQDFLPRPETYKLIKQGRIECRQSKLLDLDSTGVVLESGNTLPCDTIIFATGWQPDYSWLPNQFHNAVNDDGVYLYRHIIHPDIKNCAFVGWASTFSNSLTAHLASVWLVRWLKGTFNLPSKPEMHQEIQQMKAWKRSLMPLSSCRGSLLQLHMWNYHDELLSDAGIDPRRKPNIVAEWLQDYRPLDYQRVLKENAQ